MKKQTTVLFDSGLHILPVADPNVKTKSSFISLFAQMLTVMLCLTGAVYTFCTMMRVELFDLPVMITITATSILFTLLFYKIEKKQYLILGVLIAAAVAWLVAFPTLKNGLFSLIDSSRKIIAGSMGNTPPAALADNSADLQFAANVAVCYFAVLVCLGLSFFISVRPNFLGVFLFTFPFFEVGAAFGCATNSYAFGLMLGGWAAALILHFANRKKVKIKNQAGKKSTEGAPGKRRRVNYALSAFISGVAVFLIFCICHSVLISMGFERTSSLNDLRNTFISEYNNIFDYITGNDRDASLKDGRLYQLEDSKIKNRHYFTVEMPDSAEPVYLKGYVGSMYTGRSWEDFEDYDVYQDLFDALEEQNLILAGVNGSMLDAYSNQSKFSSGTFTFSDFRRKKDYTYLSYGAYLDSSFSALHDTSAQGDDKSDYFYKAYFSAADLYAVVASPLRQNEKFNSLMQQYTDFVYRHYLSVPSGLEDITGVMLQTDGMTLSEKVNFVRDYLSDTVSFSRYVQKLPGDTDFIRHFLVDQKKGYSAHYATAAAVLLRAAGIPTRYVEGYVLGSQQISQSQTANLSGYKRVEVTDANAHAWIEIYTEEMGWIPIEVTAGYYDGGFSYTEYMSNLYDDLRDLLEQQGETPAMEQDNPEFESDLDEGVGQQPQPGDNGAQGELEVPLEDGDGGDNHQKYDEPEKAPLALWIIFAAIFVLLLLIFVYCLLLRHVHQKRKRNLSSGTGVEQVKAAYIFMMQLLQNDGFDCRQKSYRALQDAFSKAYPIFLKEYGKPIEPIFAIFLRAGFANGPIEDADVQMAKTFVNAFREYCYQRRGFWGKRKFKWIKML